MSTKTSNPWQPTADPQPGDLATHVDGQLDSRPVAKIDQAADLVWLNILGKDAGPFPASNYTYQRWVG